MLWLRLCCGSKAGEVIAGSDWDRRRLFGASPRPILRIDPLVGEGPKPSFWSGVGRRSHDKAGFIGCAGVTEP